MGVGPTSRSSMVPGWKGGKALPFGGSFGEYSLNDFEEQPGRTEGARRGARNGWKPKRALAGLRAEGAQLQSLMSRVGQAGLAESSTTPAAQRLARTASACQAAAATPGESYNGHWAGGRGPGGRSEGRGAAGSPEPSLFARFPSTMAAPLFPLSSSSSALPAAASSRCLCLQAARPPSPSHQAPLPGHQEK